MLLVTGGLALLGTAVRSALGGVGAFGVGAKVVALAASVAVNAGLFILAFRISTARHLTMRQAALGVLTPLTDNVDLTAGDRSTYAAKAEAERTKGFEKVNVTFSIPPHRTRIV